MFGLWVQQNGVIVRMTKLEIRPLDAIIAFFSVVALVGAVYLAAAYANQNNPPDVPFLLRPDTYDKVFPFLLGTVAVGGFASVYARVQRAREKALNDRRVSKAILEARIKRLQGLYEIVLNCFQNIRLQRRRLREAFIPEEDKKSWKIRRGIFEKVSMALSEVQIAGERVIKTLDFESDALIGEINTSEAEIERLMKLQDNLKSQIGGIQGVLRNVLRTSEWRGITKGSSSDEDLINVPDGFIKFCDSGETGNLGFRTVGEYFDAFARNITNRIHELEKEAITFSEGDSGM